MFQSLSVPLTAVVSWLLLVRASFCYIPASFSARRCSILHASVPRFDKSENKWVYTAADQEPTAGYPPVNTLLLHGPRPFYERVFCAEQYEQAVLKYMAVEKVSRDEAQGNMDAYLRNPNDWRETKSYEQKTGFKADYVTLDPSKIALTTAWTVVLGLYVWRAVAVSVYGERFLPF